VTLWYHACHPPTADQIAKAERAVKLLKLPKNRYTGRLVDAFIHKGTLYVLLMDVLERDPEKKCKGANYRMMNLDDGNLTTAYIEETTAPKRARRVKV
jgi:hypothetical protein